MAKAKKSKVPVKATSPLDEAILAAEKAFGKGIVIRLGSRSSLRVETFSSGSLKLDEALGIGGYPVGRTLEIFGPYSSGKTTLALHAIANVQASGGAVLMIDAEHALDPVYAKALGVDLDKLMLCQPNCAEEAFNVVEFMLRNHPPKLIVIDSVAALVPRAELEGEMESNQIGLQARLMTKALRKMTGLANQTGCTIFFLNQLRTKIGVMFGNPEDTPGGKALKFAVSMRLDLRKANLLKQGDKVVGHTLKIKIVKNKLAAPFKQTELQITNGKGIDRHAEVLDMGVECGVIDKAGAYFSYKGDRIAQGRQNAIDALSESEALTDEIAQEIRAKSLPAPPPPTGKRLPAPSSTS